mmetsp:Transcript_10963/g.30312  ORF Transcript_10963/g.30312 Transcript_10963/m.30312 type:complete len:87 (-) Transcript_10963:247-507(-)
MRAMGATTGDIFSPRGNSDGGFKTAEEEEIEALGGDSFFLFGDDEEETTASDSNPNPSTLSANEETEGAGFEWDGVVDEDAHLDFD